MVIPDVGLDVTPTSPTIRELTVTKKKAKMAMQTAASPRAQTVSRYPRTPGISVRARRMTPRKMPTVLKLRSSSVRSTRLGSPPTCWVSCPRPSLNDSIMVGMDLMRVMIPAVATAPAPMYRM